MAAAAAEPTHAKPPSRVGCCDRSATAPTKTSRKAEMIVEAVAV